MSVEDSEDAGNSLENREGHSHGSKSRWKKLRLAVGACLLLTVTVAWNGWMRPRMDARRMDLKASSIIVLVQAGMSEDEALDAVGIGAGRSDRVVPVDQFSDAKPGEEFVIITWVNHRATPLWTICVRDIEIKVFLDHNHLVTRAVKQDVFTSF